MPALVLLAATWAPALSWLAFVALLLAFGAAAFDLWVSTNPREVSATRSHDALLSIGVENSVALDVRNDSARPIHFVVRDEPPDDFFAEPLVLSGSAQPRSTARLRYTVVPYRRGEYVFANLNVRYGTALGLWERQVKIPAKERAVVYPDILELRKHTLAARGTEQETDLRTRTRGGMEFERLREYTPDDEYRYIDWNATARVRKPIARQYQTERNQNIVLAYDLGRQMTSPYGDLLKVDYAINSGVVLGYVASQRGENIGLLTFDDKVRSYLPPRSGGAQFKRMLDAMYKAQPQLVEPDYREAFAYVAARNPRRSLIVVFTDIADARAGEDLLRSLAPLQPKHLPMLVLLMDPELKRYAEEDPQDEAGLYRMAVAQRLVGQRETMVKTLQARGVLTLDVPAEQLNVALLDSYLRVKERAML